jgi:hypothetical protein
MAKRGTHARWVDTQLLLARTADGRTPGLLGRRVARPSRHHRAKQRDGRKRQRRGDGQRREYRRHGLGGKRRIDARCHEPRATGTASGKCDPGRKGLGTNEDIHVFNAWPHMHKSGTRMATTINRKGGGQEIMLDKPFNFASQIGYDIAVDIHPGDSLFTTCYYDNTTAGPIGFGPSTTQEMCYDFLYAYPAHALDHPPFGAIVTSAAANLCTDN